MRKARFGNSFLVYQYQSVLQSFKTQFFEHVFLPLKYKRLEFKVSRSTRFGTRFATRLPGKPKLLPTFEHEDSDRYSLIRGVPWRGVAKTARIRGQFFFIRVHSRASAVLFFFIGWGYAALGNP